MFDKEGIELDTSKIVISGHSFGGISALEVAKTNNKVKAAILMDPYLGIR